MPDFYARHSFTTITEVIIKINARTKKEAEKINQDWCYGSLKTPNVRVLSKNIENDDYFASDIRERNNFYD